MLITGDHPATALAVARQCGILPPAVDAERDAENSRPPLTDQALLGAELHRLRDDELADRLRDGTVVFARTTPEQKMKIVSALQRARLHRRHDRRWCE